MAVLLVSSCQNQVDESESGTPSTVAAAAVQSSDPESSASDTTTAPDTTTESSTTIADTATDAETSSLISTDYGKHGPLGPLMEGDADGTGCTPDTDVLPDGLWYGTIEAASGNEISFDLWCRFSNERAFEREEYVGGDYVYLNNNTDLRQVPLAEGTVFWLLDEGFSIDSQAPFGLAEAGPFLGSGRSVWIWVGDGAVSEIWEPWDS